MASVWSPVEALEESGMNVCVWWVGGGVEGGVGELGEGGEMTSPHLVYWIVSIVVSSSG